MDKDQLAKLMKKYKVSGAELSRRLPCHIRTVRRYLSGETSITKKTERAIRDALQESEPEQVA